MLPNINVTALAIPTSKLAGGVYVTVGLAPTPLFNKSITYWKLVLILANDAESLITGKVVLI